MTEEKLKKEAWLFISNNDEYARIVPDGEIDRFSEFMAKFTHHLWEKDLIQSKQKGKQVMDNEQKIFELIDATFNNHWHSTTDLVKRELAKRILELIQSKQKGKELTEEALKKEAWLFIANDDEYARIVPDGEIDRFSEFMAKFTHHLWEKDLIQSKQKGKE